MAKPKDPEAQKRKEEIKKADIRLLAQLGYKQEFKRDFKPLEVCLSFKSRLTPNLMVTFLGLWNCLLDYWLDTLYRVCLVLLFTEWRRSRDGLGSECNAAIAI